MGCRSVLRRAAPLVLVALLLAVIEGLLRAGRHDPGARPARPPAESDPAAHERTRHWQGRGAAGGGEPCARADSMARAAKNKPAGHSLAALDAARAAGILLEGERLPPSCTLLRAGMAHGPLRASSGPPRQLAGVA